MATRQDVDKIYEELDYRICLSVESWLYGRSFSFYLGMLRRPELITVNYISLLKAIAEQFKLEHLVSHIHEDLLVGVEGTDVSNYTEEELSLLPKITSNDVHKVVKNLPWTLEFLGYAFTIAWLGEDTDFFKKNPDIDSFELSNALFECYMDGVSSDHIYDEKTDTFLKFNFEGITILDYLHYKRFKENSDEFLPIYEDYLECLEEDKLTSIYKDFDEVMLAIEDLFREKLKCIQFGDSNGADKISDKISFDLNESIYNFYLEQDELWVKLEEKDEEYTWEKYNISSQKEYDFFENKLNEGFIWVVQDSPIVEDIEIDFNFFKLSDVEEEAFFFFKISPLAYVSEGALLAEFEKFDNGVEAKKSLFRRNKECIVRKHIESEYFVEEYIEIKDLLKQFELKVV